MSKRTRVMCLSVFLLFFFYQFTQGQSAQEITTLELNKPIERELAGKHVYQFNLSANQYAKIIIEQRGVDIVAKLVDADGKPLHEYDAEARKEGAENIEFTTDKTVVYRLEITAKYKLLSAGRYEIRFAEQHEANEKEKALQEARQLFNEALNLRRAGKSAAAIPSAMQALEIQEKNSDAENADLARILNLLGNLYTETSNYDKAEALYQRALAIRTKVFGEMNPNVAMTLSDLGVVYRLRGEPERAEPLYRKAITIRETTLGKIHPEVARNLQNLGNLLLDSGDYIEAEKLYLQSLAIREKTLDPNDSLMASVYNALALVYTELGDNVKAETMYLRALSVSEKNLPPEHPSIAIYLDNLADVYRVMGDLDKAEPMYKRALAIREKALGPDDLLVSASLNNIGNYYSSKKDYPEAEKSYLRSLEIREKKFNGKPHPWIVQSLYNLGDLRRRMDDLTKAEDYLRRALAVAEQIAGADNSIVAHPLLGLANVYNENGDYDKAEPLYRRVLAIYDATFGAEHPTKAKMLTALAILYLAKGDFALAAATQKQANAIIEKQISLNLSIGSEQKKLAYLDSLSESLARTLTISFYAKNKTDANELALTSILRRKGRVLDEMSDTLSVLRQRFNTEDRSLLDKLNEANTKLALMVLSDTPRGTLAEQQKEINSLEEKRDQLEIEISRRAAGFYQSSKMTTLEAVRANIPDDAALIEFIVYQPLPPKKAKEPENPLPSRYAAYVVGRTGEVRMRDLGTAAEIDRAVENFRQALFDPKRRDVRQLGRMLDERVLKPLRAVIGDKKQLLISPDGALNLIPFEALVDESDHFLVENYSFNYLTSGRDLLRMQTTRESKSKSLIIANPSFGQPIEELISNANIKSKRNTKRQSITATRNLSDTYFAPLSGTTQEARSIQTLFPDAATLTEAQATETALKQATAPRILHIATHGFFLEDVEGSKTSVNSQSANRSSNAITESKNPLLRSGLAFAGANERKANNTDDGILTALEASGLNLWGTKLVVLSACDTGLGEVKNGEGVYGLRRAFVLAGTESLMMSLWSVSDYVTRELMTNYYKNLKQGMGRGAALRQVQLEMLKRKERQHPFYWAAFIQSGEWANLDGKR